MKKCFLFILLIFISIFFFGIGYASITSISMEIDGSAQLPGQTGVYISSVQYTSNVGADLNNSEILTYYQTMLGNKTTLSTSNSNSNIVYTVTVQNDDTVDYAYKEITFDPSFYDNNDIEVVISSMNVGDIVTAGNSITFTVTFRYASGVTPSSSNNVLNSYINIVFEEPTWVDLCDNNSIYLRCRMIAQTATSDASINFSSFSSSSNGRGLYYTSDLTKTEDLDGDGTGEVVYYYRGNVTNNYVRFDSYCWRIVRTNEDGSIRLIYGGTPQNNGNCPQTGSTASINTSRYNNYNNNQYDNMYMGYMYGTRGANTYAATHANTNNSTIKTTIDNWYRNNLADSASYLADYPFCNDRTVGTGTGIGNSVTEYATQVRFYGSVNNQVPTFKCNQANDKFSVSTSVGNGALTYPIALLSADESVFAGAPYATSGNNTDCYLYTASTYWLMSPGDIYQNGVYVYFINNTGQMRLYTTTQQIGTRPVINLLPGVTISGGTGAYNNPYVVNGVDASINSSGVAPISNRSAVQAKEENVIEESVETEEIDETTFHDGLDR